MDRKEEILEKLTGIQSSRLSYYAELTRAMEEMKKKSNQLRILNQLTKIHVNESWEGISRYLASQLRQAFDFDVFILSLCDASVVANHICWMENGQWLSRTQAMGDASRADMSTDVSDLIPWGREPQNRLSVPLQNQLGQRVGELILLNHAALQYSEEEFSFLQVAADYVGVVIENILLFKDLSKKVNLEAQLIQSAKLAALGEMAAGVAHELNSPLTAILGNVQLLMRGSSGEAAAQMLEDIYRCGLRCRKIIQNLLTFARQDEYAWESLNLNEVVGGVLELIGYQLQVSGITVQTRLSDDLPLFRAAASKLNRSSLTCC
ncbi:hypothetical protein GCM10025857_29720 [Alicyclobacillus contaminans]|nr:hypothetical protein GCM10025857_29720 [Alicyclobacillus contaminans]